MTNYEKWKTLSIQEAADTLARAAYCMDKVCAGDKFCADCVKEWLESEADE